MINILIPLIALSVTLDALINQSSPFKNELKSTFYSKFQVITVLDTKIFTISDYRICMSTVFYGFYNILLLLLFLCVLMKWPGQRQKLIITTTFPVAVKMYYPHLQTIQFLTNKMYILNSTKL